MKNTVIVVKVLVHIRESYRGRPTASESNRRDSGSHSTLNVQPTQSWTRFCSPGVGVQDLRGRHGQRDRGGVGTDRECP